MIEHLSIGRSNVVLHRTPYGAVETGKKCELFGRNRGVIQKMYLTPLIFPGIINFVSVHAELFRPPSGFINDGTAISFK